MQASGHPVLQTDRVREVQLRGSRQGVDVEEGVSWEAKGDGRVGGGGGVLAACYAVVPVHAYVGSLAASCRGSRHISLYRAASSGRVCCLC